MSFLFQSYLLLHGNLLSPLIEGRFGVFAIEKEGVFILDSKVQIILNLVTDDSNLSLNHGVVFFHGVVDWNICWLSGGSFDWRLAFLFLFLWGFVLLFWGFINFFLFGESLFDARECLIA